MKLTGGIVFINNDLTEQVRDTISKQLYITDIMDGYEYDAILATDPLYPELSRNNNKRVMVIRSFRELTNRETADVVIFFSRGMLAIEKNNFGPPGCTYRAAEITWGKLCVYDMPGTSCGC